MFAACNPLREKHHFRNITPIHVVPGLSEPMPFPPNTFMVRNTCSGGPQPPDPHLPDPQELGLLPRGTGLRLHLEAVDVGNGDDCGGHVPGQPHEGAQGHKDAHPEQVQMVASSLLQGAAGEEKLSRSLLLTICWGGVG